MVAEARDGGALVDRRLRADGARHGAADDRLGDHLAVHAPPGAGRDGRAGRAGGGRARAGSSSASGRRRSSSTTRGCRQRRRSGRCATRSRSCAASSAASAFDYDGKTCSADVPALQAEAHAPRDVPPVYVAATAPKMQALAGEIARRLPDAVDHDAGVRPLHARERRGATSTSAARSSPRSTSPTATRAATARARSPGCTSRTRCRTSRARPTRCSTWRGSSRTRSGRSPRRWSAAAGSPRRQQVSDALLDKCKPIAGTPGRLHRRDRGVPRRRLHARHARAVGRRTATSRSGSSASRCCRTCADDGRSTSERLVSGAADAVSIPSFTGDEQAMAE